MNLRNGKYTQILLSVTWFNFDSIDLIHYSESRFFLKSEMNLYIVMIVTTLIWFGKCPLFWITIFYFLTVNWYWILSKKKNYNKMDEIYFQFPDKYKIIYAEFSIDWFAWNYDMRRRKLCIFHDVTTGNVGTTGSWKYAAVHSQKNHFIFIGFFQTIFESFQIKFLLFSFFFFNFTERLPHNWDHIFNLCNTNIVHLRYQLIQSKHFRIIIILILIYWHLS